MGDQKYNVKLTMKQTDVTHHGVYDKHILCQECDNLLGKYDEYALSVCKKFNKNSVNISHNMFEMKSVDGDKFAIFILSILWRESVSLRPEFQKIKLGEFEKQAHEVIFGKARLATMPSYELIVCRFSNAPIDVEKFYTSAARVEILDRNAWYFVLHGFKIVAKLDKREWPVDLKPFIVNGNHVLRGRFVDFLESKEHETLGEMVKAEYGRDTRRSRRNLL